MKVAVASSGLGHVRRGIEAWASDVGHALQRAGIAATVFGGAPGPDHIGLWCTRRTERIPNALCGALRHLGGWRYGFGSSYEVEQSTFAAALWRRIRHDYDILHVQDPLLARLLDAAHRKGLSRPRVVLGHATSEKPAFLRKIQNLQHLTPLYAAAWEQYRPSAQKSFGIPNFADTKNFAPGDRRAARATLGLPQDSVIFLCSAAIRRYHKRVDYLLQEFAAASEQLGERAMLLVVGGREADTDEVIAMGRALLGDRVRFMVRVPREQMPTVYQTADVFVLPSLWEMFSIALLEAMASGLPVICHDTPDFRFAVGPAGLYRDIAPPGALAAAISDMLRPDIRTPLAAAARPHIESTFSEAVVTPQIIAMYHAVMQGP